MPPFCESASLNGFTNQNLMHRKRKKASFSTENDALRILMMKNELLTLRCTAEVQCDVHA